MVMMMKRKQQCCEIRKKSIEFGGMWLIKESRMVSNFWLGHLIDSNGTAFIKNT